MNIKTPIQLSDYKEQFIQREGYRNILNLIFRNAEELESLYKKDLAAFNREEAIEYFTRINSSAISTLLGYLTHIRKYRQFCMSIDIPMAEKGCWDDITKADLKQCVNFENKETKYVTKDELDEIVDELMNPCDKFLLYAFYEGFKGSDYEDIWDLQLNDFDFENKEVQLPSGRKIKVSDTLIQYAKKSAETYEYISLSGNYDHKINFAEECSNVYKYRDNTQEPYDPEKAKGRIIQRLVAIKNWSGCAEITVPRLANSGLINQIKTIAEEEGIDGIEVISRPRFKELRKQYDLHASVSALKERYRDFFI